MTKPGPWSLLSLLKDLDSAIPDGEGGVSVRLHSDGSGAAELHLWGATVAQATIDNIMLGIDGLQLHPLSCVIEEFNTNLHAEIQTVIDNVNAKLREQSENQKHAIN